MCLKCIQYGWCLYVLAGLAGSCVCLVVQCYLTITYFSISVLVKAVLVTVIMLLVQK